jgi:hypothetical protein
MIYIQGARLIPFSSSLLIMKFAIVSSPRGLASAFNSTCKHVTALSYSPNGGVATY